jgi:amino acid transporter
MRYGQPKKPARLDAALNYQTQAKLFAAAAILGAGGAYGWKTAVLVFALVSWFTAMVGSMLSAIRALFSPLEGP